MKKILNVSNILSWINLIIGSFLVLCALLTIRTFPPLAVLISVVLVGCIVLHSHAAMQLRKSILHATIPLSKQTPIGIRVMGYMALFFAIMLFSNAVYLLQNTQQVLKQVQFPKEMKNVDITGVIRGTSIFLVLFSISVIVNVVLNLRLLRFYALSHSSQSK
ncbi:MAG TPA: hypothetical protein VNV85_08050 [Puia sp.]|jgi:hypothetical protein|nr:hypothetical protein [Puia sp.]